MEIPKKYQFMLFISGMSERSAHAVENLRKIVDEHMAGDYDVEIVDVSRDRHLASEYNVIGIPTLIRTHPDPRRVILGDLSNKEKVLRIMDII